MSSMPRMARGELAGAAMTTLRSAVRFRLLPSPGRARALLALSWCTRPSRVHRLRHGWVRRRFGPQPNPPLADNPRRLDERLRVARPGPSARPNDDVHAQSPPTGAGPRTTGTGRLSAMTVALNHTIVYARDRDASAAFL